MRGTTKSSVIFKSDDRGYTAVTSISGMTAVGNSHQEARELYDRAVATIGFEADHALRDPGFP